MAKNAFFLAATLLFSLNTAVLAQELPKNLFSFEKTGIYGMAANQTVNTLLIPVNSPERWNLVYQQTTHTPVVSSIQFHPELHVFVAHPDAALSAVLNSTSTATEAAQASTPSAAIGTVKGVAVAKPATTSAAVITITKTEPVVSTPKPSPKPVVKPAPLEPSALDALFAQYGAEYGVSADVLKRIAQCESGLRPEALSSNGLYGGLFQFVAGTWSSNRKAMGLDPDPALRFNAEEAIKTGAFKISRDGVGAWPVCGRKASAATSVAAI